jgi:transcriptional regulator with XRE-family HTH domain
MTFGSNFKRLRLAVSDSLTDFCNRNNYHSGNISKLERGIINAPSSKETIYKYAKALKLKKNSTEFKTFVALSTNANNWYLIENIKDEELLNLTIKLLSMLDNKSTTKRKIEKLIDILNKENNIYVVVQASKQVVNDDKICLSKGLRDII